MIEIEAAQEILVGLARAAMLGRDHARHGLEQFGDLDQRAHEQVLSADAAFAGRTGHADLVLAAAEDDDLLAGIVRLIGIGCRCCRSVCWRYSLRLRGHWPNAGKRKKRAHLIPHYFQIPFVQGPYLQAASQRLKPLALPD